MNLILDKHLADLTQLKCLLCYGAMEGVVLLCLILLKVYMKVVDLHNVRHKDVYHMLEKPCVNGDLPFTVITGNSTTMKKIVAQIVATFDLYAHEKLGNSGRLVICESR